MAKREATGGHVWCSSSLRVLAVMFGALIALAAPSRARADWWSENFEIHGKLQSTVYFADPSLNKDFKMDQWWNELQLKNDIKLFNDNTTSLSFHQIIMPTYDLAYDAYPNLYGRDAVDGALGTQNAANARNLMSGIRSPGVGACITGLFCLVNQDTSFLFTGVKNPQMIIDNVIFFGILGAQYRTRSASLQGKLGDLRERRRGGRQIPAAALVRRADGGQLSGIRDRRPALDRAAVPGGRQPDRRPDQDALLRPGASVVLVARVLFRGPHQLGHG